MLCNTDCPCHVTASGHEKSASADPSATLGKQTRFVLLAVFCVKKLKRIMEQNAANAENGITEDADE